MEIVKEVSHPTGLIRLALKLPILFYQLGLGGLFGGRMLLINHVGRITGKKRQTVVEVIRHETQGDSYLVVSGWGPNADWYRNLLRVPQATIQIGRHTTPVTAIPVSGDEATEIVAGYLWRNRAVAKHLLPRLYGYSVDGSKADYWEVAKRMPVLRFIPAA